MRLKVLAACILPCVAATLAAAAAPQAAPSMEDARSMFAQANAMLVDTRNSNVEQVTEMLELAAPVYIPAAYKLLDVYEGRFKGLPEQPEKAVALARSLAERDDEGNPLSVSLRPNAMFLLAGFLERGYGCEPNILQAVQWLKRAADAGLDEAKVELARCIMLGKGVKQNERLAWKMLMDVARRAPDTPKVYYYLGYMCYKGLGHRVDPYNAARLFREGVKHGDAACMNNLGVMFEHGQGIHRNTQGAAELYRRAAELGNREASSNLQRLSFKENAKALQNAATPAGERIRNAVLRLVDSLPLAEPWPERLRKAVTGQDAS